MSVGLFVLVRCIAGAQDDAKQILVNIRHNVLESISRLPKYVCTQTVERTRYEPADPDVAIGGAHRRSCDDIVAASKRTHAKRVLSSSDRLRLDVAVNLDRPGMENEMYSWAGENRFGARDLFEFVRDGAISTGSFSAMLAAIFGNDSVRFSYNGDITAGGRLLSEFGFQVPMEKSTYMFVLGKNLAQVAMAYGGTLLADPESLNLTRLNIRTTELPPETGACEITQTLDYGPVHMGGTDFLLPREASVSTIHVDGSEADNHILYSACREFGADSQVRYGSSTDTGAPADSAPPMLQLPAGESFKVMFTDAIDPAKAAAGDPIQGRLVSAILDRSSQVLVPTGTPVTARILRIKRMYDSPVNLTAKGQRTAPRPNIVLDVKLETLEIAGAARPFKAVYDSGLRRHVKQTGPFTVRVDIGSLDRTDDADATTDIGTFEFRESSAHPVVKAGFESTWLTAAP